VKRALIFVLAALLLGAAAGEALGQKKTQLKEKRFEPTTRARLMDEADMSRASAFVEREAALARQEIEARYAELSEAVRNRDFAAYQALRTENFSARLADGEVHDGAQMARRAEALFGHIEAPISLSNQIELLILMDNEAIAIVHQKFSRTQQLAGGLHLVETSTTQRETWVRTEDGWKLKFVDNIHEQQTLVDGLRVGGKAEGKSL
jgi:ketosteroid isomerase-like protein